MEKKVFIRLTMIFLLLSVFLTTAFSEEKLYPKTLILSFPGASDGTNATALLSDGYNDLKPFVLRMEFSTNFPELADIKNAEKIISQMNNVILSVNLRYPLQMQQLNSREEIAQENYNVELLELMDRATNKVVEIINDFHREYPDANIIAAASGIGSDVLIQSLEKGTCKIDSMVFYFPTMATVKDAKFIETLERNGYTQDRVTVYAWAGDPTIPYLEKLKTDNVEIFRFGVIENPN